MVSQWRSSVNLHNWNTGTPLQGHWKTTSSTLETHWLPTILSPFPYPEPVNTGPGYIGMPLECHWLIQCTLGYHWATQQIFAGYTGTQLGNLSWNSPTLECHWKNLVESASHWDATGDTLTFAAYTGTPLEGLWQPTHAPKQLSMQSSIHASLKWQDGGTPISKWTGRCIFSLYLEFTALQWMPVLLLTHMSTSTSLCACLWYEHHYSSLCIWGCKSNEISLAQTILTIPVVYIRGRMLGSDLT